MHNSITPTFDFRWLGASQQNNMLDLFPVATYVCDINGLLKNYNGEAARLWGRKPVAGPKGELYNGAYKLYRENGEFLPQNQTPEAVCLADGIPIKNLVIIIERPDYSRCHVQINISPLRDEKGNQVGVISCLLDITAQKLAEKQLARTTIELQDYVNNANVGLHWVDGNGIIKWANKAELDMLGYPEKEYIGHHISEFHVSQDKIKDILTQLRDNKTLDQYESELRAKDGSIKTVRISSSVFREEDKFIHTRCFTIDVSEQKRLFQALTEKAIFESEEKYRTLVDTLETKVKEKIDELKKSEERYHKMIEEVEDYAIILLDKEGIIVNWNKGAEKIKGYKEEEIIGKSFQEFYLEGDRQNGLPLTLLNKARTHGKATHEGWRKRKNGTVFWGSILLTALHNEHNEIIGFSKVTRDLTEKKLAEDKTREYLAQLEFQNKELEQFVYAASHDLKEPLRKIHLYNSFVAENPANTLDPKSKEYLSRSISATHRMKGLIEDLLAYSRATANVEGYNELDLNLLLDELLALHKEEFQQKRVEIKKEALPTIQAVPFQIKQLFSNLIDNAVKYRHPDREAKITIRHELVNGSTITSFKADYKKQYHKISVTDNGIGFDSQYANRIFEIFQRLAHPTGIAGSGIGLAICKKIVQNHNGFIIANGKRGEGASFDIYFPKDGEL